VALQRAEAAIALTRTNVAGIATEAAETADKAREASRRLASVTKVALTAQGRLKEIAMVVAEADPGDQSVPADTTARQDSRRD